MTEPCPNCDTNFITTKKECLFCANMLLMRFDVLDRNHIVLCPNGYCDFTASLEDYEKEVANLSTVIH